MRRLICCLLMYLATPPVFAALDLNSATQAELDALPGVGPGRAQAIIEYRAKHGPFNTVDALRNVKGIGDKTFAELEPLLSVGAAAGVPPASPSRTERSSAEPVSPPAASSGFPWWILAGVVVAAVAVVVMFLRRRPVPAPVRPPTAGAPSTVVEKPAVPVSPVPPRPAEGTTAAGSPARPAGAPPRPAGSAPRPTSSPAAPPVPRPAGAPPRPPGLS
jgi:competence protein ComEA